MSQFSSLNLCQQMPDVEFYATLAMIFEKFKGRAISRRMKMPIAQKKRRNLMTDMYPLSYWMLSWLLPRVIIAFPCTASRMASISSESSINDSLPDPSKFSSSSGTYSSSSLSLILSPKFLKLYCSSNFTSLALISG